MNKIIMNKVIMNKVVVAFGIMMVITMLFSLLNYNLHNFTTTTIDAIAVNHGMANSEFSPLSVKPALAVSLNKTEVVGAQSFSSPSSSSSSPSSSSTIGNISVAVTSSHSIHGIAGQFVKVNGTITNNNPTDTKKSGIAYISIVDLKDKVPIDLEDWSASKGLYIPRIAGGQSLPIEWNIRLVKAGSYTVDLLFNPDDNLNSPSVASSRITMEVAPKINLNPGNVLPVAFGLPAIVIITLGYIGYRRGKKTGIYN